jgi:hypothetical protein
MFTRTPDYSCAQLKQYCDGGSEAATLNAGAPRHLHRRPLIKVPGLVRLTAAQRQTTYRSEAWSKYDLERADTAVWPRVNNPSTSPLVCPVPATIANVNGIKGPKLPSKRALLSGPTLAPRNAARTRLMMVGRSGVTASNRNVPSYWKRR